jgi:hypothetical protein
MVGVIGVFRAVVGDAWQPRRRHILSLPLLEARTVMIFAQADKVACAVWLAQIPVQH